MSQVVIVTGASSNLGQNLCQHLLDEGYKVYAGYNTHPKRIIKAKNLDQIKIDITNKTSCQKAVTKIISKENVYALVNLVAVSPTGVTAEFSPEDLQSTLETNLVGNFRLTRLLLPHLSREGRVINIGSLCGLVSFPKFGIYSSSKFALRALSLSLYYEYSQKKKYVIHLAPGALSPIENSEPKKGSVRDRIRIINWLLPLTSFDDVSRAIIGVLRTPSPASEVLVGRDAILLSLIKRLFPDFIWDKVQKLVWQKQQ